MVNGLDDEDLDSRFPDLISEELCFLSPHHHFSSSIDVKIAMEEIVSNRYDLFFYFFLGKFSIT